MTTTTTTTTRVRLFHNVAVDERGGPSRFLAGYQPEHAVVEVFAYIVPAVPRGSVAPLAERAFALANGQPEPGDENLSARYDERRLRSLSTGDLVQIGDAWWCCLENGWMQLHTIPLDRTPDNRTVPGTGPNPAD